MSKELPPQYNPKDVEEAIYRIWEQSGFFAPEAHQPRIDNPNSNKTFTIVIPPPNITGSLHMGHALNATIQDILVRKKRMEGYKTLWLPGTDHAGIATQNVVEKHLKKEGTSRHTLGREKFIERVWQWKEQYGDTIIAQLKKLGASLDWSRARFTMDDEYQNAVREAFLHYHKKGWLYRAEKVINWCTRCRTSLSDLELEYKEIQSKIYYIRYPLKEANSEKRKVKNYITVATTRPETMLGDTAVAVHPQDSRYQDMPGKTAVLPIQQREIPIIADKKVEKEFGTGAVKVTPAHDLLDAEIGERHGLPVMKVIGPDGKMTDEAGALCAGLKVHECRGKVVEALKKEGALEKEEEYIHNVASCYRCETPIEPMPSMQWFLKMKELARMAIKEVEEGRIAFHPKRWEKVYCDWLGNIKDWTISRQIWWGHRLPVWHCIQNQTGISNSQFPISKQKNTNKNLKLKIKNSSDGQYIVSDKKPDICPFCKECDMKQAEDVLDTWFSSALWPFATLGWPVACAQNQNAKIKNQNNCKPLRGSDVEQYYPTQVLSTARDIINLWVARMVFSGMEFMDEKPFKDVIIHATILTKDGRRMSKSLGTGIDPMDLMEKYGSDATRFGLIWQAMGNQDIHWAEEHVHAGKKFLNKIWNASRFVLQHIETSDEQCSIPPPKADPPPTDNGKFSKSNFKNLTNTDKNILRELEQTKKAVNAHLDKYEFGHALHELYDFFWHRYCDVYLEKVKTSNNKESKKVLLCVLAESLKLLHPFIPHITEHIWAILPHKKEKLLIMEEWE